MRHCNAILVKLHKRIFFEPFSIGLLPIFNCFAESEAFFSCKQFAGIVFKVSAKTVIAFECAIQRIASQIESSVNTNIAILVNDIAAIMADSLIPICNLFRRTFTLDLILHVLESRWVTKLNILSQKELANLINLFGAQYRLTSLAVIEIPVAARVKANLSPAFFAHQLFGALENFFCTGIDPLAFSSLQRLFNGQITHRHTLILVARSKLYVCNMSGIGIADYIASTFVWLARLWIVVWLAFVNRYNSGTLVSCRQIHAQANTLAFSNRSIDL